MLGSRARLLLGTAVLACATPAAAAPLPVETVAEANPPPTILVTARRRTEDAQQVPAALSVVRGEELDRSYTINTQGLTQFVPSLNYSSANPRNTAFTIRGLGSSVVSISQANDGLEPGVGFYVDQVYHARPATAAFDFSDIERVEVLRGPQGTLFGKNTTAGALNLASRSPSFTAGGNVEFSYGDYDLLQAKASVTGPLIGESIAYRLSGVATRRDGAIHNVVTGADHNGVGSQAVRGQLLIAPLAALQLRLTGDFASVSGDCCTQVYLRVGASLRSAARQYPALAAGLHHAPPSTDPYDRLTDIDAPLSVDTNEGGLAAIADWKLGAATLTSVSAWRFWNWDAANDRDYTGAPIQLVQHIPSRQDQYSQELRIGSNGTRAFGYVAGLYFFHQRITGEPISIYGPSATYWLLGPTPAYPANLLDGYGTDGRTDFRSTSYAVFGEANWRALPRLTLTAGLRYTWENKRGSYATTVFGGLATTTPALVNAKLSILRPQSYAARNRDGSLSGRANLAYQIDDDRLVYASFARGFKSGGINMAGLPLDAANQPVLATAAIRPERNTTWEAGIKTRWLDRRLTVNLDAFATQVRDFQATIVDSAQTVALRGYLANIPEVTVKGVEGEAMLALGRLTLAASVAFADGRYADYPAGPCPLERQTAATTGCDLTGRRLASLPRLSASAGADYVVPVQALGNGAALSLHVDASSRSSFNGDAALSRYTHIDGYRLVNASIGVRFGKSLELVLFARNLLAADYIQNVTTQAGNSGLVLGLPGDPRILGATVRASF